MDYNFVNPYNFVNLAEKKRLSENSGKRFSGVINYSLLTKTPLLIPETSKQFVEKICDNDKKDNADHLHRPFMSLSDLSAYDSKVTGNLLDEIAKPNTPYIPGSEMRGMIRSVYEILTDSCLSVFNDKIDLSKRTHEVFRAGLIHKKENNKYDLYEADDCLFRADTTGSITDAPKTHYSNGAYTGFSVKSYRTNLLTEGQKVFFKREKRAKGKSIAKELSNTRTSSSSDVGYVLKGSDGPEMAEKKLEKHNCHIFYKMNRIAKENISLDSLEEVLEIYKSNGENTYEEYSGELKLFKHSAVNSFFPVYYSVIDFGNSDKMVFLSPASITREVYSSGIGKKIHSHNPCTKKDELCPACKLFGMISKEHAESTKIRFSDLFLEKGQTPEYCDAITLAPMAEPKINMEFYLERPANNAVYWTFDYYIDDKGKVYKNEKGINGRKYYWHHKNILTSAEKTNLNSTAYPLAQGNRFNGCVYFDNITENDLNRLIFILNCGENDDTIDNAKHGYKLGSGKPLGLGSVAVKVDSVIVREYADSSYSVNHYDEYDNPFSGNEAVLNKFNVITDFNAADSFNVDYPRTKPGGDIFEWFSENHKGYNKNKIIKSPNRRTQEYYGQYMIPLKTSLGTITIPGISNNSMNNVKTTGNHTDNNSGTGKERKCSVCNKKFITRYEGSNPKCRDCMNKSR